MTSKTFLLSFLVTSLSSWWQHYEWDSKYAYRQGPDLSPLKSPEKTLPDCVALGIPCLAWLWPARSCALSLPTLLYQQGWHCHPPWAALSVSPILLKEEGLLTNRLEYSSWLCGGANAQALILPICSLFHCLSSLPKVSLEADLHYLH